MRSEQQSVLTNKYEADFACLLRLLAIRVDEASVLTELGIQATGNPMPPDEVDYEAQKLAAIAKCQRRIAAARQLFLDGDLGREEYLRRKEKNEREIVHWASRTTETEHIALELAMCIDAINKLSDLWKMVMMRADKVWSGVCSATLSIIWTHVGLLISGLNRGLTDSLFCVRHCMAVRRKNPRPEIF